MVVTDINFIVVAHAARVGIQEVVDVETEKEEMVVPKVNPQGRLNDYEDDISGDLNLASMIDKVIFWKLENNFQRKFKKEVIEKVNRPNP
jgi:hypothetical protein